MSERLDRLEKLIEEMTKENAKREAQRQAEESKRQAEEAKRKAEATKREAMLDKQMANVFGFIDNTADILENKFAYALEESDMVIDHIQYDEITQNLKGKSKTLQVEYDIVLFNASHLFIVEVKRKPHINDFKQLLRHQETFPQVFTDYKDFHIHLGLAGEAFYPEVIDEAKRLGVYILQSKADELEIITP